MIDSAVVVGTGLIGTSIALALREHGVEVALTDPDPAALRLAVDLGAGRVLPDGPAARPADVAILAAPPRAVAPVLLDAQRRGLARAYTDVASVKVAVVAEAHRLGCDLASYVPSHPMAGREKAGPGAARADLFLGRSWALCPTGKSEPEAVDAVAGLVRLCGANPVDIDAEAHDSAVALVSHGPHVAAAAVAARLRHGDPTALELAGQGVRDITRVAAGDPELWTEILRHNAVPVAEVLDAVAGDLARAAAALRARRPDRSELGPVTDLLESGRVGRQRVPGKHGADPAPEYAVLPVVIPDEPGALARLFVAAEEAGINIEDVRIEHSPRLPVGVANLAVRPSRLDALAEALAERGWSVHP